MRRTIGAFLFFAGVAMGLAAQNLTAVVPQLSPAATDTYKRVLEAVLEAGGAATTPQVMPFARAVYLIETKQADVLCSIVQLPDKAKWAAMKADYSTAELAKIVFVLYTNKAKPVTVAELRAGNPRGLKIETDGAHLGHFPFAALASTSVDASLKKVDAGDIDGYLFSQGSGDPALKRLGLKNIRRTYYDTFNASFLIQKGARGGSLDQLLTSGLAKIKANGKFQEIMGSYLAGASSFVDWQP